MPTNMTAVIAEAFAASGIHGLPVDAVDKFAAYLDLLLKWNARMNLTSVREPLEIIQRHFIESALAARYLPGGISSLLDYGSGAGFPGLPIAICRPEIRVTLTESRHKKASFLREAVRSLGTGSEVFGGRVDMLSPGSGYDAVSMRAVEKMEIAVPQAAKLANKHLAILTSAQLAPQFAFLAPQMAWNEPLPLGTSTHTALIIGTRS